MPTIWRLKFESYVVWFVVAQETQGGEDLVLRSESHLCAFPVHTQNALQRAVSSMGGRPTWKTRPTYHGRIRVRVDQEVSVA